VKSNIVVVGSSNTDMIIKLERIPRAGETLLGGEFMTAAGGKGANQAVAAARAGGRVSLVARVGRDAMGDQALRGFRDDGVDVTHVIRDARAASGIAFIFVSRNGENSIAVASGANSLLCPADINEAHPVIAKARVLLLQLETPLATVTAAAKSASRSETLIILNPAPARRLPDELLRRVSFMTPNEAEAELLSGIKLKTIKSVERAATSLRRRGARTVIITLGKRGALIACADGTELVPGFRVKAVDATGAGDVFNGVLATSLAEGRPIKEAVLFANAAAAVSVTREGAQPSAPTRSDIDRFLRSRS
jgi:ribokinase